MLVDFINQKNNYFLSKKASYNIIIIAMPINIKTGKTSQNVIIIDLVSVVARPTRKNIANDNPIIVVVLFIVVLAFSFQPSSNS